MIRGYYRTFGNSRRPFVNGVIDFERGRERVSVPFLIDTGADRTVFAQEDLARAGASLNEQAPGVRTTGVGGAVTTRTIRAVVTLGGVIIDREFLVFDSQSGRPEPARHAPALPSLLGYDLLSRFALIMDPARDRLLLLEQEEAAALVVPGD